MRRKPRILALVLHSEAEPWRTIGEAQLETWMSDKVEGCEALHYVGGSDRVWLDGTTLRLTSSEGVAERLGAKTAEAFKWAVDNREFDYLFRTNTSSYVDMAMLQETMSSKPAASYYGGRPLVHRRPLVFASGAGFALSRDMVEALSHERAEMAKYPDDVEIGMTVRRMGVAVDALPWCTLETRKLLDGWRLEGRPLCMHYRCKGVDSPRPAYDVDLMRELHSLHSAR